MLENIAGLWWLLILTGLCSGFLSGLLGVGGGIIVVPILVILFLIPQKSAQGISLAVMVPLATLGVYLYWKADIKVDLRVAGFIVMGALAGTLLGTSLAARVPGDVLRKCFAVFMIIVGIQMLWPKKPAPAPETDPANQTAVASARTGESTDPAGK
jgi:uncharacterized protein